MIRFIQHLTVLFFLLISTLLNAQGFQGKVYYKYKLKESKEGKEKMDSLNSKLSPEMRKRMQQIIKKFSNKTFILDFNKSESVFKEEEELEQPGKNNRISFRIPNSILYKNIAEKRYAKKKEDFGKVFLIKDSLKKIDWKLEKETKKIGKYTAFKATAMVENNIRTRRTKKDTIKNKKPKLEKLTVWYTPEILVSNGPDLYQGLPGLILETNVGRKQMLATKIILNPKEKIEISEPKKGKIVSQKEYDEIMKKKFEEMREMRKGNRKKGTRRRHMIFVN